MEQRWDTLTPHPLHGPAFGVKGSRMKSIEGEEERGEERGSETVRVVRKASGTIEIDVRAGFERAARAGLDSALACYASASAARAQGDEIEALRLSEIADQSVDLIHDVLCRIEGL